MKFCSISALLGLLSLAVAAPIKPLVEAEITTEMSIFARKTPSLTCASGVHIITVNGDGARDGQQGFFDSLSGSIMDAIPGSTQRIMPYDTSSRKRSNRAITGGSKNLLNWIELYHAQCPESKIVILGHSAVSRLMRTDNFFLLTYHLTGRDNLIEHTVWRICSCHFCFEPRLQQIHPRLYHVR